MVSIATLSTKCERRPTNQDALCALSAQTSVGEIGLIVVCDGVGGLVRAELASSCVAYGFARWFRDELPELVGKMGKEFAADAVVASWQTLFDQLHRTLREVGKQDDAMLGTTCTSALACDGTLVYGQVGDSRLYCVRQGRVRQLTTDQSFVSELVARGEIAASEAAGHPYANVILQAIGADCDLCPVFTVDELREEDLLVACSDGACRRVGSEGVRKAFAHVDPHDEAGLRGGCARLQKASARAGDTDDKTIACLCMGKPGPSLPNTVVARGGRR